MVVGSRDNFMTSAKHLRFVFGTGIKVFGGWGLAIVRPAKCGDELCPCAKMKKWELSDWARLE